MSEPSPIREQLKIIKRRGVNYATHAEDLIEWLIDGIEEMHEFIGVMCGPQDGRVDGLQHCRCVYALRDKLERLLKGRHD